MSGEYRRIEMITATARRRRRTTEHKLRTIEESYGPGEAVLAVARRHDVAASLWYRRQRLMSEGGTLAVCSDETVVGNSGGRSRLPRIRESRDAIPNLPCFTVSRRRDHPLARRAFVRSMRRQRQRRCWPCLYSASKARRATIRPKTSPSSARSARPSSREAKRSIDWPCCRRAGFASDGRGEYWRL